MKPDDCRRERSGKSILFLALAMLQAISAVIFAAALASFTANAIYVMEMPLKNYTSEEFEMMQSADNPETADAAFTEIPEYAIGIIEKYLAKEAENAGGIKENLRVVNSDGTESGSYAYMDNMRTEGNLTISDYHMAITGEYSTLSIRNLEMKENMTVGHETLEKEVFYHANRKELKGYAINLDGINFTNATYTTTAQGRELWKCAAWNFTLQACFGTWEKVMDIIPGAEYSLELYPGDPGYVEVFDTDVSIDIDLVAADDETLVLAWIDSAAGNAMRWQTYNTNGSNKSATITPDATGNIYSRVSVESINSSNIVLEISDMPSNASRFYRYNITGTLVQAAVNIDVAIGSFNDVDICELGTSFVLAFTDDAEGDADFIIRTNAGAALRAESFVDGTVNPEASNQNLISCTPLNVSHFMYAMFDDGDNDVTIAVRNYSVVSNTNMLTRDLDTNVGETGQVDSASLGTSIVVIAYYDSTDDDISYNITQYTNAFTNLAGGDIDSNAGTDSRVSVATIRNDTNYLWVVAWYDQLDATIKAEVRSDLGAIITPTFNITITPAVANPIVALAGYNPLISTGLCNSTFAIAYSNATGGAVLETLWSNGSRWDGYCPESNPPNISLIFPYNNMRNTTNRTVLFKFNVTDQSPIVNCSLYLNGILNMTNYTIIDRANSTLLMTLPNGEYNWSVGCTDYFNATNMSGTYNFNISAYDPEIKEVLTQGTIMLNAGGVRTIQCNATVEDNNGVADIQSVNATMHLYNTSALVPNNNNTRYANSSCVQTATFLNISNYTCTFTVQYYATNGTWFCNFTSRDTGGFVMSNASNMSIEPLYALNLSNLSINYGDISTNALSADRTVNVTNFGNMPINITVRGFGGNIEAAGAGYAMLCASGSNITLGNQRYSKFPSIPFASKAQLTSADTDMNITLIKQSSPVISIMNATYWQLFVPPMDPTVCNGTVVFTAGAP